MAQQLTEVANTTIPGSYIETNVKSSPIGVSASGIIAIFGEADGGPSTNGLDSVDGVLIDDNYFAPSQADLVKSIYIRGSIVDAFNALCASSADTDITGAPNRIYIGKTNVSSKSSAILANAYGTLKDKKGGLDGNKFYYQVSSSKVEVPATITTGDITIGDGSIFNGLKFSVRINGGAVESLTLSSDTTDHDSITKLAAEIDGLLPSGLSCADGGTALVFSLDAISDNAAQVLEYGRSFELIDSEIGDLAALEVAAGLIVASQEPEVQVNINRDDINVNEEFLASADVAMLIGYEGTTATMTINTTTLTTTVVSGSGSDLSITLNQFTTLKDLCDYINTQPGYTCTYTSAYRQKPTSILDQCSAIGICSTNSSVTPGRVKVGAYNFNNILSKSFSLDFTPTATKGLPQSMTSVVYLSGGARGATTAANIVTVLSELESVKPNILLPLFSRNAVDDIAEDLTDSNSTYTIAAINALTKTHLSKMSTAKMKRRRIAICSIWDTFANAKAQASSSAYARVAMAFQKITQVNSDGIITSFLPWYGACIAAGMQAAGFYKAIFNKYANVISFTDPVGFKSNDIGNQEDAIESGLLVMTNDLNGNQWLSDQTTYGVDTNFVYNSIQAMYCSDLVALDLADSFQRAYVGKSFADIDAGVALGFLTSKMNLYKTQKLIASSSDAPLGFKNSKITLQAPWIKVKTEIKLATGIYFIPIELDISAVTGSAE